MIAAQKLVAAAALAVFASVTTPVYAYWMAGAMVNVTNFELLNSAGGRITPTTVVPAWSDNLFVSLNAASNNYVAPSPSPADLPSICVGLACSPIGENSFPKLIAPPSGNYAAADQRSSGVPIDAITIVDPNGRPILAPASFAAAAYVAMNTETGSAMATSATNFSMTFVLAATDSMTIKYSMDAYAQAAYSSGIFPSNANSASRLIIQLTNLSNGSVLDFSPSAREASRSAPVLSGVEDISDTGGPISFELPTPALLAGVIYTLDVRASASADLSVVREPTTVPEPGSIALLGMGLFATMLVGRSRRRR